MDVQEHITRYLDSHGVSYRLVEHAPAGSADEYHEVLETRYEQQAKALLLRVKRNRQKSFAVVTLQAQKRLEFERAARLLHAREVRLATDEQLLEVTGCRSGELPPFGKPFDTPLLFDSELTNESEIYFNLGSLSLSMVLDPAQIVRLEDPLLI